MASTSQTELKQTSVDPDKNIDDLYGIRNGVLFLIDASDAMFEEDPQVELPYFLRCLRQYRDILRQKLLWNSQDWMGLILFGSKKGDNNSDRKNILTLRTLNPVSKTSLLDILGIEEENEWKDYKNEITCSTFYPLHDALWYASRMFSSVKVTMPVRRILLFTCQDNPPLINDDEKRRIVGRAKTMGDTGIQLTVIGLGEDWDHNIFYKDFEISSQGITSEDYKRPSLNDLLHQIKLPSRTMAKLPWRVGGNVILDVNIANLNVKRQYLKKSWISKARNDPLTALRVRMVEDSGDEDDENKKLVPVLDVDICKFKLHGGRRICFTLPEAQYIRNFFEPGIDLICAKPIFYHPSCHCKSPYLVTPGESYCKDNTLLFGALLEKCNSRNLMFICAVTFRKHSAPFLFSMIPKSEIGGFYLYKIPYKERVRNLESVTTRLRYLEAKIGVLATPDEIELVRKMINKLKFCFTNGPAVPNPKLQTQLRMVETLALDLEKFNPPEDKTLSALHQSADQVKNLIIEYKQIFNYDASPPRKRSKRDVQNAVYKVDSIRKHVRKNTLNDVTVPELKGMSRTLGLKMSGNKAELVERITKYCNCNATNSKEH
ncbi:X-ray repair cross-complementing protein 6 [Augochlora pura]